MGAEGMSGRQCQGRRPLEFSSSSIILQMAGRVYRLSGAHLNSVKRVGAAMS